MDPVKDLLNKISDFKCEVDGKDIAFLGILQEENGSIILNAKFPMEQYRKEEMNDDFAVLGNVSGNKTTLIGCHIKSTSYSMEDDYISVLIIPNEIIVGGCFSSTPMAKTIIVSTEDLNYMFSKESPLNPNVYLSKENPSVLNYTFPKPIIAKDKYGEINLYQTFGVHRSVKGFIHNIISVIEYSFDVAMPVMEAVAKTSAARSLFSFFGNGYISFGEIKFEVDADDNKYDLWLNYKEDIPTVNRPFFIHTSIFKDQFHKIWEKWLHLYESANPIPTLFYEIVCNRSTRINGFLNLSQAIEVYSNTFRNKEVKEIAKKDPNNKSKEKDVKLKHRYQDILSTYNGALELIESNIEDYAQGFSNMRNYYTHYNSRKYVKPTNDELFSAIHILRFVLLTIVYTAVGISLDNIIDCKKSIMFSGFDDDAGIILKYSKKKTTV